MANDRQRRRSITDRISDFQALADQIDFDGMDHLIKENPSQAAYLLHEIEQRKAEMEQAKEEAMAKFEAQGEFDGLSDDEAEALAKRLQLQAELPFKQALDKLESLETRARNELAEKHSRSSTPKPGQ